MVKLFHISEPDAPSPQQHRVALGIDLGTTNSLVGAVIDSKAQVLPDATGCPSLPSAVSYGLDGHVVGEAALERLVDDPKNTVVSVKRHIGRRPAEVPHAFHGMGLVSFAQKSDDGVARFDTVGGAKTAVEVSADILTALKQRAQTALGSEVIDGVVVTVPAYFDDTQRQATQDAAKLAGLKVLRLLNEPTAAAVAYGLGVQEQEKAVIYDLGGGTFDVSVVSLERGVLCILAIGGDTSLGGDDFDLLIVEHLIKSGQCQENDVKTLRLLLREAATIKMMLSEKESVTRKITLPNGHSWEQTLTRNALEKLISPLVEKTIKICHTTMHDAGIAPEQADNVVLVGGATRTPLVRRRVAEFFKKKPVTELDPDQVVAIGAAVQADILIGNRPDNQSLLLDVIPLSLGIETAGGLVERIIPRNTTIPCAETREYTTQKDGQTGISILVVQGERERVSDCRTLTRFELKDIPPLPAGMARVGVRFQVDADGLLTVEAWETTTNNKTRVEVKPLYGLEPAKIEEMLRESARFSVEDVAARKLRETQVEAHRVLEALDKALQQDRDMLHADEHARTVEAKKALVDLLDSDDSPAEHIKVAMESLEQTSEEFISRRMNRSISSVLKGHAVDKIGQDVL